MAINVIDPNEILFGNSGLNYKNYENFIPEYQNMIPYVEFFSIKRDSIVNYLNNNNTLNISNFEKINLLGFDDDAYENGEKLFTAKYLDNDPSGEEPIKESFGIKSIDIKTNASYVPTVEINFVDVRGQSYFAKTKGSKSKYSVLLDFPPPLFVLRMKGVYGMLVEYRLHLTKTNIKLNSSNGNYEIKANFIGYNIAPLTDINLGILNSVHFLRGLSDVNIDFKEKPRTIHELIYVGKILITKLDLFKKTEKYKNFKEIDENLENLCTEKDDVLNQLKSKELFFNNEQNKPNLDYIQITDNEVNKTITVVIDNTKSTINSDDYNILINAIKNYYTSKINDLKDNKIISGNDISINPVDSGNKFVCAVYYKNYIDNYNKKESEFKNKRKKTLLEIQNNVSDILNLNIWKPTIKNITEIITNDIDFFFNELQKAANKKKDTIQGLNYKNLNNVTNIQFPDYIEEKQYNNTKQLVKIYPGKNTSYRNWGEVELVEKIIKGIVTSKTQLNKLDELIADIEGDSKWIPIIPYENKTIDEALSNEYFSKTNLNDIFSIVLKRFCIAKNLSYKGFFTEKAKELIKMVAKFEARNLLYAINNQKTLLQELETFSKSYNDINSFLNKIPNNYEFKKPFGSNDTFEYFTISNKNFYPRNNKEYNGLYIFNSSDVKSKTITDTDNEVEKLLEEINDLIKPWFTTFLGLGDTDNIKLSSNNLIVFIDILKNTDNNIESEYGYASDFYYRTNLYSIIYSTINKYNTNTNGITFDEFFNYSIGKFERLNTNTNLYKFYFSGLIEMPVVYLLFLGWLIKNNKTDQIKYDMLTNLSLNDKDLITKYYDDYISDNSKILIDSDFLKNYSKLVSEKKSTEDLIKNLIEDKKLMNRVYLMNNSPFTFSYIEGGFYTIPDTTIWKDSEKYTSSNGMEFTGLDTGNQNHKYYFTEFFAEIKNNIKNLLNQLKEKESSTYTDLFGDEDIKTELYYSLKNLFDRWLAVPENNLNSENLYKTIFDENITKSFKFVDRAMNTVAEDVIMDYSDLIQDATDYSLSAYTVLTRFYSKNNFLFFPLQSSLIFTGDNMLDKLKFQNFFKLNYQINEEATSKAAFVCMFINSFSSNLNIDSDFFPDDALSFLDSNNLPSDFNEKSNAYVFIVSFGKQNQSIFNNIELSTAEFNDTFESLKIVDMITKNNNDSNPITKGQNLYNVIRQRSYSATIEIPLGNICIQPTMYFELVGTPIFNGGYLITDVEHNVDSSSNKIRTKFRGTRVGKFSLPMVIDPLVNINNYLDINSDSSDSEPCGISIATIDPLKYSFYKSMSILKMTENSNFSITEQGKNFIKNKINKNKDNKFIKDYLKIYYKGDYLKYVNDLISWIEKYSKQYKLNPNILSAQLNAESEFLPYAYNDINGSINAMGISQFVRTTINDIIFDRFKDEFTVSELNKISQNITLVNGLVNFDDKPKLLENVQKNPEIMVKAQAVYLKKGIIDYKNFNSELASIVLYCYAQGPNNIQNSYGMTFLKKYKAGEDPESYGTNPPTQGTNYTKKIFDSLKSNFGLVLDNEIDYKNGYFSE